jgi:hypothetical protein
LIHSLSAWNTGNVFIDRDPRTFPAVIQFLRCNGNTGFLESESDYILRLLIDEALFYQHPELARDATMELERREKKKKMISFPQLIEILNMKLRTPQLRRLAGVCFFAADLYGVEFESCNMHCCNFEKANLSKCRFIECNLDGTNFSNAILKDALFERCDLLQTDFSDAGMHLSLNGFPPFPSVVSCMVFVWLSHVVLYSCISVVYSLFPFRCLGRCVETWEMCAL